MDCEFRVWGLMDRALDQRQHAATRYLATATTKRKLVAENPDKWLEQIPSLLRRRKRRRKMRKKEEMRKEGRRKRRGSNTTCNRQSGQVVVGSFTFEITEIKESKRTCT